MASPIITITFEHDGDFVAANYAEAFLASAGFSVGTQQRGAPRGILYGLYDIQKWRNLSERDKAGLHGTLSSGRIDPATIKLCDTSPIDPIIPLRAFLTEGWHLDPASPKITISGSTLSTAGGIEHA